MRTLILSSLLVSTVLSHCASNAPFHHFTFGDVNAVVVTDGPIILEDNFFTIPFFSVAKSYQRVYRSANPVVWQQNVLVFDLHQRRFLVDVGAFNLPDFIRFRQGGQLLLNLKAADVQPESIDIVLLTHGHPDHVAGLTNLSGEKVFPNAQVYVGKTEHQFWAQDPVPNPNPQIPNATMGKLANP